MKKNLLLFLVVAATFSMAYARSLSPSEALKRAIGANPPSRTSGVTLQSVPSLTLSAEGSPMLYVFENENRHGYLIVSAEDVAAPVLGYSDSGTFDADSLPSNLRWWLDCYKGEIAAAINTGVTSAYAAASRAGKAPIAPLVTTKWDQDAPYNDMSPSVGNEKCPTGCVATAFAQLLNYHKYPTKGTGSHSYTWNGKTLSFDYGATTFQWDKMLDTYTSTATTEQINAVATLMYACGVAVDMDYALDGSGAASEWVIPALIDYFNYDKGVHIGMRDYVTATEWEDMIYADLSECGPVFYAGQSNDVGHAFLCDGYRDGYFHFNWGWSGMSDGYFLLSALDPGLQGIGGGNSGFDFNQRVILGVKKPGASSTYAEPYLVCYNRLSVEQKNGELYLLGPFLSLTPRTLTGKFVLELVDSSGKTSSVDLSRQGQLEYTYGYNAFSVPTRNIPDGTYKGYIKYESDGKKYTVFLQKSQRGYIDIKKSGNTLTAQVPDNYVLTASDLKLTTELYVDNPFICSATISGNGAEEMSETLMPLLLKTENINSICAVGSQIRVNVPANGSVEMESLCEWDPNSYTKLTIGDYYFCLGMVVGSELSGNELVEKYAAISPIIPVKLKSNLLPATVKINSWWIENPTAVDPGNLVAQVNVTGGIGYYAQSIGLYIFPQVSGGGSVTSVASAMSEPLFISGGQNKMVTITCDLTSMIGTVPPGSKYFAALRDMVKNDWFAGARQIQFTIGESGIENIEEVSVAGVTVAPNPVVDYATVTAPENIVDVKVVSMSGALVSPEIEADGAIATINVSSIPAGIYVVRVTTVSGAYTAKLVKR